MTSVAPCPYLPGKTERKVFANLPFSDGAHVNDELTLAGFRRSQNIAYRPACEACDACVSVRLPVPEFTFSRSQRKVLARNADLSRDLVEAEATTEQFQLLRRYLTTRHPTGGMSDMGWLDYVAMVEDTAVRTHLIEYRLPSTDGGPGDLVAVTLTDLLKDGLSMVYSFYDPTMSGAAWAGSPSWIMCARPPRRPAVRLSRLLGPGLGQDGLQGRLPPDGNPRQAGLVTPRRLRRPFAAAGSNRHRSILCGRRHYGAASC